MSIVRAVRSALKCAGHWVGETYCAFGQRVAERFEQVSDTIAEKRDLAESHGEPVRPTHAPEHTR